MDDEIRAGTGGKPRTRDTEARSFVPMQVGEATVYIEVASDPLPIEEEGDGIYPAAPAESNEVFGQAGDVLKECVRVVGDKVAKLGDTVRPEQVSVEFSLSFEAAGKAHLIPVLFTGATKATSGLKVTAVWGASPAVDGTRD